MILLNDASEREGGKLPNLVPFAQSVLRATEDLVQVGQKLAIDSADEVSVQVEPVVENGIENLTKIPSFSQNPSL